VKAFRAPDGGVTCSGPRTTARGWSAVRRACAFRRDPKVMEQWLPEIVKVDATGCRSRWHRALPSAERSSTTEGYLGVSTRDRGYLFFVISSPVRRLLRGRDEAGADLGRA